MAALYRVRLKGLLRLHVSPDYRETRALLLRRFGTFRPKRRPEFIFRQLEDAAWLNGI
jgi:hypothetical protein